MRRLSAFSVLLSTWISCFVPASTRAPQSVAVGIGRIGTLSNLGERAYPILENRVRLWLENADGSIRIKTKPFEASWDDSDLDAIVGHQIADRLSHVKTMESDPTELMELLDRAQFRRRLGPLLQEGYITVAASNWKRHNKKTAVHYLKRAQAFHPAARLEYKTVWPESEFSFDWSGFEEEIRRLTKQQKTLCNVFLPASEGVSINGFSMEAGLGLSVVAGNFLIEADTVDGKKSADFNCKKAGRYQIALNPSGQAVYGALESVSVGTHFLIEPRGDEFRFYLYTPGVGLDEIPVEEPVRVAQVLAHAQEDARMPFSTDAFLELFNRHHGQTDFALQALSANGSDTAQIATAVSEPGETAWYKKWEFWAVLGAIGVTALAVGLSNENSVAGQNQGGVRFNLE